MKQQHTPYTYLIGWSSLNKWYYGVRYAKNCNPSDLWVTYKTSSKIVKKFASENGNPDIILIRRQFTSIRKAQDWESKVLKKMNVAKDSRWLNGHDTKAFDPCTLPRGNNHWTREDSERAHNWRNGSWRNFNREHMPCGENHWTSKNTESALNHKKRMHSKNNPNYLPEVIKNKSNRLKLNNPVHNSLVREKISKTLTGKVRPKKVCEHCNKTIADSIYTRHHGSKCKEKSTSSK